MIHVLHLVTWLNPGGLEYWLKGFIESTRTTKIRMSVVCKASTKGTLSESLVDKGTHVECCPMLPSFFSYPHRLSQVIRRLNVDLVHNHMGAMSFPAIYASQRANVPVISTFHSPQFAPQSSMAKFPVIRGIRSAYGRVGIHYALKHSNFVTGVSQGVLQTIYPEYAQDKRFRVTYLGLPNRVESRTAPYDIRSAQQWPSDAPLIMSLGRLSDEKNPLAALEVFREVHQMIPNAKLAFVGQGPLLPLLKQTAVDLGISSSTVFLGYRDDALQLLSQASVLLQTSNYEGFGLAVIEAGLAGVPAVASDIPGLREAIVDKKTGYLHRKDDQSSMAKSVIALATDTTLRNNLSTAAKRFVDENFREEKCREGILSLYHEALTS